MGSLAAEVKLKLHFLEYDGQSIISDAVIDEHISTTRVLLNNNLISDTYDIDHYEAALKELTVFRFYIAWTFNAIDKERVPTAIKEAFNNLKLLLNMLLPGLVSSEFIAAYVNNKDLYKDLSLPYMDVTGNSVATTYAIDGSYPYIPLELNFTQ